MTKQFLALIPARYGSTRFPGKPLANIQGKPMIQHVYERAADYLDTVCVATDDRRIEEVVQSFGGRVVMTAETHQSGTDRCAEALDRLEQLLGRTFDVVFNIQGDEPFIDNRQLKQLSEAFNEPGTQIATLVKKIEKQTDLFDVNKPKVVVNQLKEAIYFSRAPIPYYRNLDEDKWLSKHQYYKHIGLYAYRADVLRRITKLEQSCLEIAESLEQLRWLEHGYRIAVRETDIENISIDTPADLRSI